MLRLRQNSSVYTHAQVVTAATTTKSKKRESKDKEIKEDESSDEYKLQSKKLDWLGHAVMEIRRNRLLNYRNGS